MKIQAACLRTFFSPHGSDLTPEDQGEVPPRTKIKRPPGQAACVILRNNYGFFGVGEVVAGRAGVAAGREAGAFAAPAGLVAGAVAPAGFVLS